MDNIFGQNFLGRQPAWHGLGTIIPRDQELTVADALTLAGADYEVRTTKLVTEAFGKRIDTGRVALVRSPMTVDPEPRILGVATKSYVPVQNRELAGLLGQISEANDWPVETIGVLGRGERVFFTLAAGEVEVPGDASPVGMFYFISGGHDGGHAVTIGVTPVRIVCQNTLMMGLASASFRADVAHKGAALAEVQFQVNVVAQMQSAATAVTAAMRLLAATPVTSEALEPIFEAAYPTPLRAYSDRAVAILGSTVTLDEARKLQLEGKVKKADNWEESVKTYRDAALVRLEAFNDEYPQVANTPWAAYNAVVETEQYRRGKSNTTRARDVLFNGFRGQNITRAWDAAYAIASN